MLLYKKRFFRTVCLVFNFFRNLVYKWIVKGVPLTKYLIRIVILICVFAFFGYLLPEKLFTTSIRLPLHNIKTKDSSIHAAVLNEKQGQWSAFQETNPYASRESVSLRRYSNHNYGDGVPATKKLWVRISDDVFVYSAYLDTRNFTTSYPMLNNSFQHFPKEGQGVKGGGDSDKFKHTILIRIVGMKAVPPLREFIKGDVLDWFRMKHELDYSTKYKCQLFFTASFATKLESIPSHRTTYTVIEEGVKIYAGCYFNCYFSMNTSVHKTIQLASLADSLQVAMFPTNVPDYPTKLIDVGSLMSVGKTELNESSGDNGSIEFKDRSLAICVRPLFGPFDELDKLIQFISYYHSVGITRFNFYSMSISPRVRKYLVGMIATMNENKLPRFIINDWNLPTGNTSELWDYGTLAALNDCLFANVDQEYVVFVDIDEFIVPTKKSDHLLTLWTVIDSYNKTQTFQYLVRNTFFCHEFCETVVDETKSGMNFSLLTEASTERKPDMIPKVAAAFPLRNKLPSFLKNLTIFQCFTRTKRIWNAALRSKFIVNPREVLQVGHHISTKYVKNVDFRFSGKSVQVDPSIAVMHHYRECSSISSPKHPILTRIRETDKTMLKFEAEVLANMRKYYLP